MAPFLSQSNCNHAPQRQRNQPGAEGEETKRIKTRINIPQAQEEQLRQLNQRRWICTAATRGPVAERLLCKPPSPKQLRICKAGVLSSSQHAQSLNNPQVRAQAKTNGVCLKVSTQQSAGRICQPRGIPAAGPTGCVHILRDQTLKPKTKIFFEHFFYLFN